MRFVLVLLLFWNASAAALNADTVYASKSFLAPNEYHNYLHFEGREAATFQARAAVIAVGTLRAFNLAAVLKRDALVAFDINLSAVKLNEKLAQMILAYDREEFVKRLLKGDRELDEVLASLGQSPFDWRQSLTPFSQDDRSWNSTFFASDSSYEHLRKLIREGRFRAVPGDLAGPRALREVASKLRTEGYVVSELDISNAIDYLYPNEAMVGFLENLKSLPFEKDSRVLLTVMAKTLEVLPGWEPGPDTAWEYLTVQPSILMDTGHAPGRLAFYRELATRLQPACAAALTSRTGL